MLPLRDPLIEDINENLQKIFRQFDNYCKEIGCFYDIVSDEKDEQGYVIKDKKFFDDLNEFIQPLAQTNDVYLEIDKERRDGVLFKFTPSAIADGCWKANPKTKEDYSPFADPRDARKVRSKQTIYQKRLAERIDLRLEDQYKSPNTRHTRKQSAFPSSIGPTRSFGGIKTKRVKKSSAVSEMIEPELERNNNVGLVNASRTNDYSSGERKNIGVERQDLTDLPSTVDFIDHDSTRQNKIPGTNIGRTNDDSARPIVTKVVPDASLGDKRSDETMELRQQGYFDDVGQMECIDRIDRIMSEWLDGREMPLSSIADASIEVTVVSDDCDDILFDVIPDDVASKEAADPLSALANKQNMRPLGVFGPADSRQDVSNPVSNVTVQHPKLHDAGCGNIVVNK